MLQSEVGFEIVIQAEVEDLAISIASVLAVGPSILLNLCCG